VLQTIFLPMAWLGRSRVPASRAANRFFPASVHYRRSGIADASQSKEKMRLIRLEHGDEGEASPKASVQPADRLNWRDAVCCLNLKEAHFGSSNLGYVL